MRVIALTVLVAVSAIAPTAAASAAPVQDRTRPFEHIGIAEARKQEGLRPVLVAVIDTALAPAGLELVRGPHGVGDLSASPDSHGSRVAGIVGDRRPGSRGVAPNAVILPIRVFEDDHLGQQAPVAAAIRHAVERGARIINVSASIRRQPALDAAVAYATENDVLVVVAAGNPELADRTIRCAALATHPDVLTVAAAAG
jgi:subtilisin family serine protease